MPHSILQDPETGIDTNITHDHSPSQPTPNQPLQGDLNFGDSSEPLFSMYTKTSEEEDNKMVETWQKDADGIVIFTGLFSAAVAALLGLSVPDLRPNSQDTSAFYLGNIYGVLADPNATTAPTSSPLAKPPPFSAPRFAVWVNSLWFLSLVMSVSCALWATSLNQWARRYISLTQPARCSPEKRARMRAFYANGVDKMHTPWAVEGLPILLHLSLFLFFVGLIIFLFHVDQEVFTCVVTWIGIFSIVYGLISLLPLIRHDSPYNTPLSTPLWFLFSIISTLGILFYAFTLISFGALALACWNCCYFCCNPGDASFRFRGLWINLTDIRQSFKWSNFFGTNSIPSVAMKAEETAERQSSVIDGRILGWIISALGDDDSLGKFFEAMPGFFDSELVKDLKEHLPYDLLREALAGFLVRTFSTKSVANSVKLRRLDIFMDTINLVGEDNIRVSSILETIVFRLYLMPLPIDVPLALAHWCSSSDRRTAQYAQSTVANALAMVEERDDRWVELAARITGLPEHDLRDIAQTDVDETRDNLSLATLIDICHHADHSLDWEFVKKFAELDIQHTLPRIQHDFCALWNEFVDKARTRGDSQSTSIHVLNSIRQLYLTLHQGTVTAPAAFTTGSIEFFMLQPSLYPQCNIADHRHRPYSIGHASVVNSHALPLLNQPDYSPHPSPHRSASDDIIILRRTKQEGIDTRPRSLSEPTTVREITKSSQQPPTATSPPLPAHANQYPTHASLPGAVAALHDTPAATTLSHPLERTTQQGVVAPFGESDIAEILSAAPALVPVPASTPPVLNESFDAGAASIPNSLLPQPVASDVGYSIPVSLSPSRDLVFPNAESLAIHSSTTPSRPTDNTTLPRLQVRGLINNGSMSFANAVLQLLVRSPRFWNLFKELGDLKGQRGARGPQTGGATPLVDATTRLFEEFVFREESPPPLPLPQQVAGAKTREDEDVKRVLNAVDSFKPIYMYDAMREKRQLNNLLDGPQRDAEEFFRLYLDALDEELLTLLGSISDHKSATVEGGEVSQSGQTEEGKRGFTVESVESPLMQIFGGKFRSTVRAPNQPDNVTIEDWRSLHLDIQHNSVNTIDDALARISHLQPIQLGPSGSSEASQQVLIEGLPPVLVVHLRRFLYDAAADGIVKISKPVWFGPELEIPLEIMTAIAAEPVYYKLYGVLYHHGGSAGSGHYTVDVLHPNEDSGGGEASNWLRIDDEAVSAVRHDDVFGGLDDERVVEDRCAYMLFYCRTDLAWALA